MQKTWTMRGLACSVSSPYFIQPFLSQRLLASVQTLPALTFPPNRYLAHQY